MSLPFRKMHGAGNDFVIFDARQTPLSLTPEQVRGISARDNPVTGGCDQLIILEPSHKADAFMRIYNADGSQVDACGNATRCVAGILEQETARLPVTIETNAGLLQGIRKAELGGEEYILVNMGLPRFDWQSIPLALPTDQAVSRLERDFGLVAPQFVSMGNPHVVLFLAFDPAERSSGFDTSCLADVDLSQLGPSLEHNRDIFPEGVNVSLATLQAAPESGHYLIHARVWERGAGLTQACGTAACAMLAVAHQRDAAISHATVCFEPFLQRVSVHRDEHGHMLLGGPVTYEFDGTVTL